MKMLRWHVGCIGLWLSGAVQAATCSGPVLTDAMYRGITSSSTRAQVDALIGVAGVESVKYARFGESGYDMGGIDSIGYQWIGSNGSITVTFDAAGSASNRSRELSSGTSAVSNDAFGALGPNLNKAQIDTVLGSTGYEESTPLTTSEYLSYRWGSDPYVSVGFINGKVNFKSLGGKALTLPLASATLSESLASGLAGKTLSAVEAQIGRGQVINASYDAGVLQNQGYAWKDASGNSLNLFVSYPGATVSMAMFTAANNTNKVTAVTRSQYESISFGMSDSAVAGVFGLTRLTPLDASGGGYVVEDAAGNSLSVYSSGGQVYFRAAQLSCGGGSGGARSFSISGLPSGANNALKLTAAVNVAAPDAGSAGSLWVIALVPPSTLFALTSSGWGPVGGSVFPPYKAVTLGSHIIPVLDGSFDVSSLVGVQIFVGYGKDQSDLINNLKFSRVHQIQ